MQQSSPWINPILVNSLIIRYAMHVALATPRTACDAPLGRISSNQRRAQSTERSSTLRNPDALKRDDSKLYSPQRRWNELELSARKLAFGRSHCRSSAQGSSNRHDFSDRLSWRTSSIICLEFTAGHFHGREKRGYEVSVHMNPPRIEGYYFWQWSWDGTTDFWPTAIICFALIFMAVRRSAGRG